MLETWAEDGTPMQRLGDRVFKGFGIATVGWSTTGGAQSGTIVDSRWGDYPYNDFVAFVIGGNFDADAGPIRFSLSGNTLTWSFYKTSSTSSTRPDTTFIYGIV